MTNDPEDEQLQLINNRHAKFFLRALQVIPSSCANFDTNRVTLAYFSLSGLDLLKRLDLVEKDKEKMIDWLYLCMVSPPPEDTAPSEDVLEKCGFRGSTCLKISSTGFPTNEYDHGHVAMTYTAIASLLILGDDLSRVNRPAVLAGIKALQLEDGSFKAALQGGENDMRFLYCAATVCSMLNDWSGMDQDLAMNYVVTSIGYDGGIGQGPELEAHGGSTYCAVAALVLMGRLKEIGEDKLRGIKRWCISRQHTGFQGRPNKPEDTCYSFWVGATLRLLDIHQFVDAEENRKFVLSTQDPVIGGLAKWPDNSPDPLHTYLGLAGLSLAGEPSLEPVDPALNISCRAFKHLQSLQASW